MNSIEVAEISAQTEEKLAFYQKIMDNLPAVVYINEFKMQGNLSSFRNVWSNRFAQEFIGYSQDEVDILGFRFFENDLHPDDLEIIKTSTESLSTPIRFYPFLHRLKPRDSNEYKWMYGNGKIIGFDEKGLPNTFLNVVVEISNFMHTENQLTTALKEISQLKNELRLKSVTKREKEILGLIAKGNTDKKISEILHISMATAKTHRNKLIRKLDLNNTASLVAFAVGCGL
jgi:DNA-binding CsgD family transcriptional regulator